MVRGFYSAAAGVLSGQKVFNTISNNIANASTAGYKSQSTIESSFGEHFISRVNSGNQAQKIGKGSFMTVNISEYTDFQQGALENTGRSVDLAISGEGFFLIESEKDGEVLTRNGHFEIDEEGDLILPGVGKVLNDRKKPVNPEGSEFTVDAGGNIIQDGDVTDTLYIANSKEGSVLKRLGEDTYLSDNGIQQADVEQYKVIQGVIEKSNINIAQEMSKIIAGQNHYQSCTQVLKIYDNINQLTNEIGKIG